MTVIGEISSIVDVIIEWKIANFFSLSMDAPSTDSLSSLFLRMAGFSSLTEKDGDFYWSPHFCFGGERWYLGIYPNGSSERDSSGYVDLYLCKYSSNSSIRQAFSLSLKTVKGGNEHEKRCTEDFEISGGSHEFLRFIPRSELSRRRTELVPDNVLTVACIMKSTTSSGSNSNAASASVECCNCKKTFNAMSLTLHQKKCMNRPITCPDCLEVITLQKWLDKHECQQERPEGDAAASSHEKKVVQDLKELFLLKEDCDVIMKVKGLEIPAHRVILKARSPVFASTFRHDMKESATGVVEIEDCDPTSFSDFLRFLYCGDIKMISQENVFGLFTAADKYEVLDLKAKCLTFMKKNMTVDTFCETITLALRHSETELIALATDFFVRNAKEILLTVKWQAFAVENPTQSNELVIKFVESVKHLNA